jgi:hypothetical protein
VAFTSGSLVRFLAALSLFFLLQRLLPKGLCQVAQEHEEPLAQLIEVGESGVLVVDEDPCDA